MISLILCGGKGERLWPLSRAQLPKPFAPLVSPCLFSQTAQRLQGLSQIWVCTGESLRDLSLTAQRRDGLPIERTLYEPVGRNTAPAIALAVKTLLLEGHGQEILGVFPSDHWIGEPKVFHEALGLAQECAKQDFVVTLGIQPDHPATGFGYLHYQKQSLKRSESLQAHPVVAFMEKPHLEQAEQYIKSGDYVWNSGMFVFKVQFMAELMSEHMPKMWQSFEKLKPDHSNLSEVYSQLEPQSIDYGVMEKTQQILNIPVSMGWSDLGTWEDVASLGSLASVNRAESSSAVEENFAFSLQKKRVEFLGVRDLMLIDTKDALLVTRRGLGQEVRKVVEGLNDSSPQLCQSHEFESRPWGEYENLHEEPQVFKTKVITIDPGQQLSYQSHTQRIEIWVVVQGKGEVVLNDEVIPVEPGATVTIPLGAKHRMRNTQKDQALKFVEVQLGDSFAETDITRYEDDYSRS